MKYLIYSRVSTEKQDTETQLRMCLEYIEKKHPNGKFTYKIFDEGDLTSQKPMSKRPLLMQMLEEVKKGDTVIVYELDRLARDVLEQVSIYRTIVQKKLAQLFSLNDNCDEMTVTIMGAIAQRTRERIQGKTKDKLETKKKNGERYSRYLPYGYALHETKLIPIRVGEKIVMKRGILVPIHEEQEVLKRMIDYNQMGLSYQKICNILTLEGSMNREGNEFHSMSIHRILKRHQKIEQDSSQNLQQSF